MVQQDGVQLVQLRERVLKNKAKLPATSVSDQHSLYATLDPPLQTIVDPDVDIIISL
jgi:hypothetical protein